MVEVEVTGIVVGSCRIEAECMVAVEIDPDTLDAADCSAVKADIGVAVDNCVVEVVGIAEGTAPIVETIVRYFSIATGFVPAVAEATVADSTLEVVVDTVAREEAVVVVETSYEFLSTKKYTVAYYTRSRRTYQQAFSVHNSW